MKKSRLLLMAVPVLIILIGLVIYQYGYLRIQQELASLRDRSIISEAEFQEKKRILLEKI